MKVNLFYIVFGMAMGLFCILDGPPAIQIFGGIMCFLAGALTMITIVLYFLKE